MNQDTNVTLTPGDDTSTSDRTFHATGIAEQWYTTNEEDECSLFTEAYSGT